MTTLAQMFNTFRKNNLEWASGKIETWPNLFRVVRGRQDIIDRMQAVGVTSWTDEHESGSPRYFLNRRGYALVALVHIRAVRCPNVDMWPDAFHDENVAWIPVSACRKCKFYQRVRETRYNYPTCRWAQEARCNGQSAERVAVQKTLDAYTDAVAEVNRMMT